MRSANPVVALAVLALTMPAQPDGLTVATRLGYASNARLTVVGLTGPIVPLGLSRVGMTTQVTVEPGGRLRPGAMVVTPIVVRVGAAGPGQAFAEWFAQSQAQRVLKDAQIEILDATTSRPVLTVPLTVTSLVSLRRDGQQMEAVLVPGDPASPSGLRMGRPVSVVRQEATLSVRRPEATAWEVSVPVAVIESEFQWVLRVPIPDERSSAVLTDWILATLRQEGFARRVRIERTDERGAAETVDLDQAFPVRITFVNPSRIGQDGVLPPEIEIALAGWNAR